MLRTPFVVFALAAGLVLAMPARADDVRAAIEAANAKMAADYAAGDTKAIAAAYTEDGVMLPPDATRIAGRAAIEDLWKSWIAAGLTDLTLTTTDLEHSGDYAFEIGDFSLQAPVEGGGTTTAAGNYLVVWKRGGDGAWRLKIDTWNDAAAPAAN